LNAGLARVACGQRDPGQQAMGLGQMIVIGRRRRVVMELPRPSARLFDVGNLQAIFAEAVIKLRGYGKIQ
jgi:hypothetical protein